MNQRRQKRILTWALTITIICQVFFCNIGNNVLANEEDSKKFLDINSHWAEQTINDLASKGVVQGEEVDGDRYVYPDRPITRGEFVAIVDRAYKLSTKPDAAKVFADINETDWFKGAVDSCSSNGIIGGYPDGTFQPYKNITRAEMATVIVKMNHWENGEKIAPSTQFSDLDANTWYYKYIVTCNVKGIIRGYSDNTVKPERDATRAEAFVIISKAISTSIPETIIPVGGGGGGGGGGHKSSSKVKVDKPSAKPIGGSVSVGTELILKTTTSNATIRYTVGDGNQASPTENTGAIYDESSKPRINSSAMYKVIAFKSGMAPSDELDVSFMVVDSVTGTVYGSGDSLMVNKVLKFTSDEEAFTSQTDDTGYFTTHIKLNKKYDVTCDGLSAEIISDGTLGGIKVVNNIGRIELGKALASGNNKVVLQPRTVYLNKNTVTHSVYDPQTVKVAFDSKMDLVPGDIIILPPTEDYQGGMAVEVQSVTGTDTTKTIETIKPEFKEVFSSVYGVTSTALRTEYFIPEPGVQIDNSQTLNANSTDSRFHASDVQEALKLQIQLGNAEEWSFVGALKLTGSVEGDIDWAWELDLVDSFDFNVKAQQEFTGNIQYVKRIPKQFKKKLGEFHIPTGIPGITIDIPVNAVITPEGKLGAEFKITTSENIGLKYDDTNGMRLYPEDKFQADTSSPVITAAAGIKAGLEFTEAVAGAGIDMVGIAEQVGFFGEILSESSSLSAKINYGVYMQAKVTVPIVDWVSGAIEKKFTLGSITIGDSDIKDFRITPSYLELAPGESKTFTLQAQSSTDDWKYLTDEQYASLTFSSNNPNIIHIGKGEIKAASDAESSTATITFKMGNFTKTATVKIVKAFGTLQGIVKDAATNNPLSGVSVILYDGDLDVDRRTTTSSTGQFSMSIPVGSGYKVIIQKEGYIPEMYQNIDINANQTTYLETILQINNNYSGIGKVSGKVINALDGKGITGLTINLRKGINVRTGDIVTSTQTGTDGLYAIESLSAGNYTGEVAGAGYNTGYFTIICLGGMTMPNQDATVTANLLEGQTRIVLTWGDTPWDLDSHLTGPGENGDRFHTYFGNKSYSGYADLDLDDTYCFGPETTTIRKQIDGVYRFTVYDYTNRYSTNSTQLANSNATVKVYRGDQLIATYHVPNDQQGNVWTVFELNGSTLTPINQIYDTTDYYQIQAMSRSQSQSQGKGMYDIELLTNLPEK